MKDKYTELSNSNKSVANNVAWSVIERVTSQLLSTIVSVVLARLLCPEDYASVALVTIFINLAGTLVSSSFSSALIYDSEQSIEKYSTAFYSVLFVTLGLYAVLYIVAPFLAYYYEDAKLISIIRVMSFVIVLQGVYSILFAYVSKNMIFRNTYKATLVGAIAGAIVAILLALNDYGVWALVALPIIENSMALLVLWKSIHFKIRAKFNFCYVKSMIRYCAKFVLVDFINSLYSSLNSLIIAKWYSKADLSYYTKAYDLPQMLLGSVNTAISKVLFPFFSTSKDNLDIIKKKLRMGIQLSCYVLMPMMFGVMLVSEGLVTLLFTRKWIGMVPYLRIMCMVWIFQPVQICAIQAYKAVGKGDDYLKLEIYKKVLSVCILISLLYTVRNPIIVAWALLIGQIISCIINMPYLKKLLLYSFKEQISDLAVPMTLCICMGICVYLIGVLFNNPILRMFVQILIGIITYIAISAVTKNSSFRFLIKIILQHRR